MKAFIKFLLCTLFLCVQSSQAYVTSAALWRFNENAGTDAGTEVLVLGDYHEDKPIGKEHGAALINKVKEWMKGSEKIHFMLEDFPCEHIIKYDPDTDQTTLQQLFSYQKQAPGNQTISIIRTFVDNNQDATLQVKFNRADYRYYLAAFNDYLLDMHKHRYYLDENKFKQVIIAVDGYHTIVPDLNLKDFIVLMFEKTNEKIQSLIEECMQVQKEISFQDLFKTIKDYQREILDFVQLPSGQSLLIKDLQPIFLNFSEAFSAHSAKCADLGFALEFLKNQSQYKRHVIFLGAWHAAVLNTVLQESDVADKVLEVGPCMLDEFQKTVIFPPIETPVLKNILNLAFTGVAKEQICLSCFCQKQDWQQHRLSCSYFWHGLLTCKSFLFGAAALTACGAALYTWYFGK